MGNGFFADTFGNDDIDLFSLVSLDSDRAVVIIDKFPEFPHIGHAVRIRLQFAFHVFHFSLKRYIFVFPIQQSGDTLLGVCLLSRYEKLFFKVGNGYLFSIGKHFHQKSGTVGFKCNIQRNIRPQMAVSYILLVHLCIGVHFNVLYKTCQRGLFPKFDLRDRHARGNNFLQRRAIFKCMLFNCSHAFRDKRFRQSLTARKCPISNRRHTVRNNYTCQSGANGKGPSHYFCHAVRNNYTCQSGATIKYLIFYFCHATRNDYACQSGATGKGPSPYFCHAVRNNYTCQSGATVKGSIPDTRHAARDDYALQ